MSQRFETDYHSPIHPYARFEVDYNDLIDKYSPEYEAVLPWQIHVAIGFWLVCGFFWGLGALHPHIREATTSIHQTTRMNRGSN